MLSPAIKLKLESRLRKNDSVSALAAEFKLSAATVRKLRDELGLHPRPSGRPKGWRKPESSASALEQKIKKGRSTTEDLMTEFGVTREYVNSIKRKLTGKRPQPKLRRIGGRHGRTTRTIEIERRIKAGVPRNHIARAFKVTTQYIQMVEKRLESKPKQPNRYRDKFRRRSTMARRAELAAKAKQMQDDDKSVADIARLLGISETTVYNYLLLP